MRKCVGVVAFMSALICSPVLARADETALALRDVQRAADASFPLLKAAELERALAAADVLSAEGGFDATWKTKATVAPIGYYESFRVDSVLEKPTTLWGLTPFVGYKLGIGSFPIYDGRLQTLDHGEVRAGATLPLWRNGSIDRRRATLARAELGTRVADLGVVEQKIQVRRAAGSRYWSWVAAGRKVAIAETLLRNVVERDAAFEARVSSGDLPPIDRDDNARALEQRRAQLAAATRGLEQAALELRLYLRDPSGRALDVSSQRLPRSFPEPDLAPSRLEDDIAAALARRPEVRRLDVQDRQNDIELRWAKNQATPGIDLQLLGSQDIGPRNDSRPDLSRPAFEASVIVDIPLETRVADGRRDAALALVTRLALQRTFAKDRIETDVRDAHSAVRTARERIEAARKEVALARRLEAGERLRYEQGDSTLLVVNIREQQTAESELREVDALFDYHRARVDLEAARGD